MDPRKFASLPESDFLEPADLLLALTRRFEILVFWREIDRLVYAEVCEFFAQQLATGARFRDVALLWTEEAIGIEKTATRLLLLARLIEEHQAERAAQLRLEAVELPSASAYQRYSELVAEVEKLGWDSLTRGQKQALLERLRGINEGDSDEE